MIFVLVLSQIFASVLAADRLQAPETVEVEARRLRWTGAQDDVSHSVEWRRFLDKSWSGLSECGGTSVDSCDVSAVIRDAEHGCVRLRVRAQRGLDQSDAVEACGVSEDRCTPQMNVSASPGSIAVRLTRHHPLRDEFALSAQHQVCYWSLDRPEPLCENSLSSLTLPDLDPGRTYCVTAQYLLYGSRQVGLRRCPVCLQVPGVQFQHSGVVLGVVLPALALALGGALAYVIIFHKNKVKTWLKPEPEPDCLTLHLPCSPVCSPSEEQCSIITGFKEIDQV